MAVGQDAGALAPVMTSGAMIPPGPDYPAQVQVAEYSGESNRHLVFWRYLLTLAHLYELFFLYVGGLFMALWNWFVVLFTGNVSDAAFRYGTGVLRWTLRVQAYLCLLTDEYPPHTLQPAPDYPVDIVFERPAKIARWRVLVQGIMSIPAAIVASALVFAAEFGVVAAWFVTWITKTYPEGIYTFVAQVLRFSIRVYMFQWLLTEQYPPFQLS